MRCAGRATDTYVFLHYITHAIFPADFIILALCFISYTGANVFLNIFEWCVRAKKFLCNL